MRRSLVLVAALAGTLATVSCGGDSTSPGVYRPVRFLVNAVQVPMSNADFAMDLNGDGTPENRFGAFVGALAGQGFDLQADVDAGIAAGTTEHLLRIDTHDTLLVADQSAVPTWYVAATSTAAFPGPYTADAGEVGAAFHGAIANHVFSSESPVTTTSPREAIVRLRLFGAPIVVHVNGAALSFAASSGALQLTAGRLNGSLSNAVVQTELVPGLATALTARVQADTSSSQAHQIETLFDVGGCGSAVAHDYQVLPCEVMASSLVAALLAPDVQIYSSGGAYAPNPANTSKNALSFGIGFTAARTTF